MGEEIKIETTNGMISAAIARVRVKRWFSERQGLGRLNRPIGSSEVTDWPDKWAWRDSSIDSDYLGPKAWESRIRD